MPKSVWRRAQLGLPAARELAAQNRDLREQLQSTRRRLRHKRSEVRRLRRQRARLRDQRSQLRATVKELRGRDDLGYLFIVTYGRSGSTLLQGILNAIPGYLIRGENSQVLRQLFIFHETALASRTKRRRWLRARTDHDGQLPVTHPFFGIDRYPLGRIRRDVRRLFVDNVLGPEKDTRVIGFKEIRWLDPDTPEFVAWIQDFFPNSRFVINTRNLDDVSRSGWWGERDDSWEELEQADQMLRQLASDLGDAAYHVHYDDYVANPEILAGLFNWLGEEFDVERVHRVMELPHSFELPKRDPDSVQS